MAQLEKVPIRIAVVVFVAGLLVESGASAGTRPSARIDQGVRYSCSARELVAIKAQMSAYLRSLDIPDELVDLTDGSRNGQLVYTLATPRSDVSTLELARRSELRIATEPAELRLASDQVAFIETVSRKEIMLALLQHGRLTELKGPDCSVDVLSRHVELRQTIVAWAERLRWGWPDGGSAAWNTSYWNKGTPRPGVPLADAIDDVFANQESYTIGCYTATKLVVVKGVLDYFRRARQLPGMADWVESRLLSDREPLVDVEPAVAWRFESDFDARDAERSGKITSIAQNVAPKNFVPGDWVYLLNTDPASSRRVGYEGSTSIYLGGGRFSDYYGDNNHAFTYLEKLDEVFQWRHGVFDLKRDAARRQPQTTAALERLGVSPSRGGLVLDWRITPALFGEALRKSLAAPPTDRSDGSELREVPLVELDEPRLETQSRPIRTLVD